VKGSSVELSVAEALEPEQEPEQNQAATFAAASVAYLPPPAGLVAIIGGIIGAQILSTLVYVAVARIADISLTAPGGPGFATGNAAGRLSAGIPYEVVRSFGDLSLAAQLLLQAPLWLSLAAPLPLLAWRYGPGITRLIGLRMQVSDIWWGLPLGVILKWPGVPAIAWLVGKALGRPEVEASSRQVIEQSIEPLGVAALLLFVGICAPIFEEVFFRGLTLRMMERRVGSTNAVLLTALVFAMFHFDPVNFAGFFVFGVAAGVLAIRQGRVGPAVWAHIGFGLTTVVIAIRNLR